MSSTGLLVILVAIFIIFNADKLAWVFMGKYKLNRITPDNDDGYTGQLPGPPGGGRGN